jgi:uncharacterized membrane protein YphA (DoxX/SURF4 family)
MKSTCDCDAGRTIGMLFARLPLGLSLAHTGFKKIHDTGVEKWVSDHVEQVPSYMPHGFGNLYLHAVPYAEVGLGALLVVGLLSRVSGLLTALMLVSFAMAMNQFVDTSMNLPFKDPIVYACFALIVLFAGPGKLSIDALLFPTRRPAAATPPPLKD